MQSFLLFTAGFSFMQFLAELVTAEKSLRRYLAAGLYFSLGLILLHMTGRYGPIFENHPRLYGWILPVIVWAGPMLYYYLALGLKLDHFHWRRFSFEMAPGFLGVVLLILTHPAWLNILKLTMEDTRSNIAFRFIPVAGSVAVYAYFIARFARRLKLAELSIRTASQIILPGIRLFVYINFIMVALAISSFASGSRALLEATHGVLAGQVLLAYLFLRRHPTLLTEWLTQIEKEKYKNSQLGSVDLARVQRELDELLEEKKIFQNSTLSLEILAGRLNLTRHQLSEYFNAHLGINFAEYINSQRVRFAEGLLRGTNNSMLDIGYRAGFASKSAFNRSFRKIHGMSPTEFRTLHQPKPEQS